MTENIDGEQEFGQSSHFGSISVFLAVRYGRIVPGEVLVEVLAVSRVSD